MTQENMILGFSALAFLLAVASFVVALEKDRKARATIERLSKLVDSGQGPEMANIKGYLSALVTTLKRAEHAAELGNRAYSGFKELEKRLDQIEALK